MGNLKYYLYDEVCIHNKKSDFWVVTHGNILDLTPLLNDRADTWNSNLEYFLAFGGKDLSHYFHINNQPKTEISPVTGWPRVLFPPILELAQSCLMKSEFKIWSQDPFYHIGRITRRERKIRIINTLTAKTTFMKVCDEDTIYDIQRKYKLIYNNHAGSYLWRKYSKDLQYTEELILHETLDGNGLTDEVSDIELPLPAIWLYYTDDLTMA